MNSVPNLDPTKMAKIQQDFLKKYILFSMQTVCTKKCIPDYKNPDLSNGEKNCIDRCVFKYFESNDYLGKLYSEDKLGNSPSISSL